MVGRWTKGLLHLLVGGACAALVAWLVFGFTQTLLHSDGVVRVAMAVLVVATLCLVGVLLLAPPVRPAEVALARILLEVDLADPADTRSWGARGRGLLWAVLVIVLGGMSLLALLWCLPQGAALGVAAFTAPPGDLVPSWLAAWPPAVLVVLGLALIVAGAAVQPLLVTLLRRLASRVLGPTAGDRLAHAEQQRQSLLRAHELARELHDSVGHALTAIGVQAEAGARVADQDPAFARAALARIAETTRQAVAELDTVLGTLRAGAGGASPAPGATHPRSAASARPGLAAVVDLLEPLGPDRARAIDVDLGETGDEGDVDPAAGHTAYRVVQEALTNARRHGTGEPTGHVRVADGEIDVLLENPCADTGCEQARDGQGLGLLGMTERVSLLGGSLQAGPVTVDGGARWRLEARWPARVQEQA